MGKRKKPPKDAGSEAVVERQTQEKAELVPPSRRPPTALGTETPQPPSAPEPHGRSALFRVLQAVRAAVGAVLDLADAAADAVTKTLQGRA